MVCEAWQLAHSAAGMLFIKRRPYVHTGVAMQSQILLRSYSLFKWSGNTGLSQSLQCKCQTRAHKSDL